MKQREEKLKASAVILAAGLSSRMGVFKPLLKLGSISLIQRIISTFRQSGVEEIVVVTGNHARELERHVAKQGVICLQNRDYASSEMFDSVKIGLSYLAPKCSHIFLTPVDVPLFTRETVARLLQSNADAALPICGRKAGHPVLLRAAAIPGILEYQGENGLAGAISGLHKDYVSVRDEGILFDADTPEDYRALLDYHNKQLIHPEIRISIARERPFLEPETALLLQLIGETESVRSASARTGVSYSKCWKMLAAIEEQTRRAVVQSFPGGGNGGKTCLTEYGRSLLDRYRGYQEEVARLAEQAFSIFFETDLF